MCEDINDSIGLSYGLSFFFSNILCTGSIIVERNPGWFYIIIVLYNNIISNRI